MVNPNGDGFERPDYGVNIPPEKREAFELLVTQLGGMVVAFPDLKSIHEAAAPTTLGQAERAATESTAPSTIDPGDQREDGEKVDLNSFAAFSREMYGDEIYGVVAKSIVAHARNQLDVTVYRSHGYLLLRGSTLGKKEETALGNAQWNAYEPKASVLNLIEYLSPPCTVAIEPCDNTVGRPRHEGEDLFELKPGEITKPALTAYITKRQGEAENCEPEHELAGTIGKAMRVLRKAAGMPIPDSDVPSAEHYITIADLQKESQLFNGTGMGDVTFLRILDKISQAVEFQLLTGQPNEYGEVMVEGGLHVHTYAEDGVASHAPESISLGSLTVLADMHGRSRWAYTGPKFLRELHLKLTERSS